MKRPEPVVDAVHPDAGRAPPAGRVDDEAIQCDERRRRVKQIGHCRNRPQLVGERVPKEHRRRDDSVGLPEPPERECTQRTAYRAAHEQCARKHRNSDRDAGDDREVHLPVIG